MFPAGFKDRLAVDAKCVDPLVAGKRLTSVINTGLKY